MCVSAVVCWVCVCVWMMCVHILRRNTCVACHCLDLPGTAPHAATAGSGNKYLSELPNSTSYRSPVSVATAIDDMAETIVVRATQRAKEAIAKAGHRAVRHHWHSK